MVIYNDLFANEEVTKFYFASRDSSGNIRGIDISYEKVEDNYYRINRCSYKYHCKHTEQPSIDIDDRGLERDAHIRVQMRVKAICKEYIDKGYKQLEKSADDYTIKELDNIVQQVQEQEAMHKAFVHEVGDILTQQSDVIKQQNDLIEQLIRENTKQKKRSWLSRLLFR